MYNRTKEYRQVSRTKLSLIVKKGFEHETGRKVGKRKTKMKMEK
jgi:hypothetical protein